MEATCQTDGTRCARPRIWSSSLRNRDGLRGLCICLGPNSSMYSMSYLGLRGSISSVGETVCGLLFHRLSRLPLLLPGDISSGSMMQVLWTNFYSNFADQVIGTGLGGEDRKPLTVHSRTHLRLVRYGRSTRNRTSTIPPCRTNHR